MLGFPLLAYTDTANLSKPKAKKNTEFSVFSI